MINSRYYPRICLESLRKNMKNLNRVANSWDSDWTPSEHTITSTYLVKSLPASFFLCYNENSKHYYRLITQDLQKLTAFWPAGVNDAISIWTKCCIQNTPAHISCLNRFEQFKLAFSSMIQSQVTIYIENSIQYVIFKAGSIIIIMVHYDDIREHICIAQ